jgi:transposase
MRYELTNEEWTAIKPMLPNKPRGVPRVNDRRVLNGIFWVLRSGAPWRDLRQEFGPYTTCYNRFVRWRRAGVWTKIMNALAVADDAAVQMIDTSIVRVHQHGACVTRNRRQSMGRSRGGLTSKIHAVVDTNGLPVRLALTAGEAHDNRLAGKLLSRLKFGTMLLADGGYDADWIRPLAAEKGLGQHPTTVQSSRPDLLQPKSLPRRNLLRRGRPPHDRTRTATASARRPGSEGRAGYRRADPAQLLLRTAHVPKTSNARDLFILAPS